MKNKKSTYLMIVSFSLFFIFNLIKSFPFDENFSKIYYVGFNTHYFYHITNSKISEIFSIPKEQECIIEECKDKYQNSPPSFWLSLIFLLIPKKYHSVAFSIFYLISSFILLFFSIRFCIKRENVLIFVIVPYISSLLIRFMMTGGIIFHILPSILCIIGWEKLKNFQENRQNRDLIYTSILNSIACLMNITFIIPVMITYITHIKDIKRNFFIPVLFLVLISPIYIIYFLQSKVCFPPEWQNVIIQEIFGGESQKNLIYSIKIMITHSFAIPMVAIISLVMLFLKIEKKEDIIICLIITIGIFSSFIPGIIFKGLFFPRFEMIPVFIMSHLIYKDFLNSNYVKILISVFGIISSIQAVKTKDNVSTFKNFPYDLIESLIQKVNETERESTILIETLGHMIISEDSYLLSIKTNKKIKGLFMDASSILLRKDQATYVCSKSVKSEPISSAIENFKIDYVICKTKKCSTKLSQICKKIQEQKIENFPMLLSIFKCEHNKNI